MSRSTRSPSIEAFLRGSLPDRTRRVLTTALLVVAVAGLVLATAYGDWYRSVALLGGVVLGALAYWQGEYRAGKEVYGNLVISLFVGPAVGLVVVSAALSMSLDVAFRSVVWSAAAEVIFNTITVLFSVVVGVVVAIVAAALGVEFESRSGVVLGLAGVLVFVGLGYAASRLWPETAVLTSPMLSRSTVSTLRLYQFAGLASAVAVVLALRSLLDSPARLRVLLLSVALVAAVLGAAGVAGVQADIADKRRAEAVGERLGVDAVAVELREGALRVTLALSNPTGTPVERGGAFVAVTDGDGTRLVFGPATAVGDPPGTVGPGDSIRATYEVALDDRQVEQVRAALDAGGVLIEGRQSVTVLGTELAVEFACSWDGERCSPNA